MAATKQTQTPVYTTAGTLYNPTSSVPLQAPTRRGRVVKWPLEPNSGFHRGFQTQQPPQAQPQYTPLQQNFERAVSPSSNSSISMPAVSMPAVMPVPSGSNNAVIDDEEDDDLQVEGDAQTLETLRNLSVKSLTNLASYENPIRKLAQKVLSRGRMGAVGGHRLRSEQPSSMYQSDGVNESADTVLFKGPGAPQPLTAGPPGLRQYRSSALDNAIAQREADASIRQDPYIRPGGSDVFGFATVKNPHGSERVATPTYKNAGFHGFERVATPTYKTISLLGSDISDITDIEINKRKPEKVFDTLSPDEASSYYTTGYPNSFSADTVSFDPDWKVDRPATRVWVKEWSDIADTFYAGNGMLSKSIEEAFEEQDRRHISGALGNADDMAKKPHGKVVNRKLTTDEANAIPTSAHALPLLSMMYQTLLDHPDFCPSSELPKLGFP